MTPEQADRAAALGAHAIAIWGLAAQRNMVVEELGELLTVLMQRTRGRVTVEEVIDELADVQIMLVQAELLAVGVDGRGLVESRITEKLNRLAGRLANTRKEQRG